ncbi:DegQ family serine endoprotease [Geoalkalibacter subterraneus]|nr:DegQ family serine endoprotease [Geoalkalibacter subterraneus]
MKNRATHSIPFNAQRMLQGLAMLLPLMLMTLLLAPGPASAQESGLESLRSTGEAFRSVAKKVSPAVVNIQVEKIVQGSQTPFPFGGQSPFGDDFFRRFFGIPMPEIPGRDPHGRNPSPRVRSQGSGFIFSDDGLILTNNHVVENADKVNVTLTDGRNFTAEVIGSDPASDVAVIKIESDKKLPFIPLGNSDALEVGDWVLAVGNPFGLSNTITAGIVSAKGRSSVGITDYENFIQTDAAINPGNSGGPLVNLQGEVVGMNTAIFSRSGGYMGIGFAIPVNMIKLIRDQLIDNGSVSRGYMGVMIQNLTPDLAENFGLDTSKGVLISQVTKDSPADKAGLRQGDIVIEFSGEPVDSVGPFRNRVALSPPGSEQEMTILRDGKRKTIKITLGTLPDERATAQSDPSEVDELGLTVQPLTEELAQRFGYTDAEGVIVTQVAPGSIAARARIRPGTLIQEVNQQKVTTPAEFHDAMKKGNKDTVLLLLRQGDAIRYVALRRN